MKLLTAMRKPIALMLFSVSLVFFYSVSVARVPFNIVSSAMTAGYSGEDYFRGVIFQKGPIANMVPESFEANQIAAYTKANPAREQAIVKLETKIIEGIRTSRPEYFESFKHVMQSGNQILIKNKITESQDLIFQTLLENSGVKITNIKAAKEQLGQFLVENIDQIKSLKSDYYAKNISLKEYNEKVQKIIASDQTGILTAMRGNFASEDEEIENEACVILAVVFFVAVAAVGYLAAVLAAAVETSAAVHFSVYLWKVVDVFNSGSGTFAEKSLRYDQYINSIAVNLKAK